ncbi:MAG: Dabb family protein, partial [Xenococcaceae cyanobacterium]
MKKSLFVTLLVLSVPISALGGSLLTRSPKTLWHNQPIIAQESEKTLHHIVLFNLKDSISTTDKAQIMMAGETLLSEIPGVVDVQLGDKAREDREVHIKNYDLALH